MRRERGADDIGVCCVDGMWCSLREGMRREEQMMLVCAMLHGVVWTVQ